MRNVTGVLGFAAGLALVALMPATALGVGSGLCHPLAQAAGTGLPMPCSGCHGVTGASVCLERTAANKLTVTVTGGGGFNLTVLDGTVAAGTNATQCAPNQVTHKGKNSSGVWVLDFQSAAQANFFLAGANGSIGSASNVAAGAVPAVGGKACSQ